MVPVLFCMQDRLGFPGVAEFPISPAGRMVMAGTLYPLGRVFVQGVRWWENGLGVQALRGHSSAGRAPALHAGGRRFDPAWLHHRLQYGRLTQNRQKPASSFREFGFWFLAVAGSPVGFFYNSGSQRHMQLFSHQVVIWSLHEPAGNPRISGCRHMHKLFMSYV